MALISCVLGKEAIVEIVALSVKTDIALIVEILVGVPIKAKIDVSKTIMSKTDVLIIVQEGRFCRLVDEVLGTSVNDFLSYIGAKIDCLVVLGVLDTINLVEVVSMLDVVKTFLAE